MNLKDVNNHLVDLRRSDVNWEMSDPKKGKYTFRDGKKVYLRFDDYKDSATRPSWKYQWVAYDDKDDFRNFNNWKMKFNAEPVMAGRTAEIWPEPLTPTVEGHYRYMDLILMRVPLDLWIDKLEDDRKLYDKAREGLDKKFRSEAKAEGAEQETIEIR